MQNQSPCNADTCNKVIVDCKVKFGEVPAQKTEKKTVATMQFEMLRDHPYEFTSDDILFRVHAIKNNIDEKNIKKQRELLFCQRTALLSGFPVDEKIWLGNALQ